jgi:hypothetical protein
MVPVSVVVLPNNDRFSTMAVPIAIVFTITIPIAMDHADGHTTTAHTDTDFFRSGGNCAANAHHGDHGDCIFDHCVLL